MSAHKIRSVVFTLVIVVSALAAGGGVTGQAAAQETSISIDTVPDNRIVVGEAFDVHVSGYDACFATSTDITIYEVDNGLLGGRDEVGSASFFTSDGDFDKTVSATVPDNVADGDGSIELEAELTGNCITGSASSTSGQHSEDIYQPDSIDPTPIINDLDDSGGFKSWISPSATDDRYKLTDTPTITLGESLTVRVGTENIGGTAGEYSTVQMQYPSFTASGDNAHFTNGKAYVTGDKRQNIISVGPEETVRSADDSPEEATSWQTELSMGHLKENEGAWFENEVTPQTAGEFEVLVRTTLTDDQRQSGADAKHTYPIGLDPDPDQDGYRMQTITVEVQGPPDADAGSDTSVTEKDSVTLNADGSSDPNGDRLSYSWEVISGPGSLSSTSGESVEFDAPDLDSDATATVELTADDGYSGTERTTDTVEIDIDGNAPPSADAGTDASVDEKSTVTLDASSSSDPNGDQLSYSWEVKSGPGSLDSTSGQTVTFSAPDLDSDATASVELTVDDGQATTTDDTDTVSVRIDGNAPPTANDVSTVTDEGTAVTSGFDASDLNGDSLTYTVTSDPSSGSVTTSGDSFTYTPDPGFAGSDSFTYRVSDGNGGTDTASVSISIDQVNAAPTANAMSVATDEGTAISKTFDASDPDGDSLSYTIVTGPTHGSVSVSGSSFTYTPENGYSGSDSFTYEVDDGNGETDTAAVSVSISSVNSAPTANDMSISVNEGASTSEPFDASDPDGDALSYSVTSGPEHGTVSVDGDSFTYTADADYSGSDSFTYEARDGNRGTDTATVMIAVDEATSVPEAGPVSAATAAGTAVAGTFNASDPDGDALSYSVVNEPENGSVSVDDDSFTYTPDDGFTGSDSFTYEAADSAGNTDTSTVSISVASEDPGFISGSVITEGNDPVVDAVVTVLNASGGVVTETTVGSSGTYTTEVQPGEYTVTAESETSQSETTAVVESGATTTANLVFPATEPAVPTAQNGVAVHDGYAYVVSSGEIQKINLTTNRTEHSFSAPMGQPRGLAYGNGSLWFADGDDSSFDGEIVELDPETGETRSRIDTGYDLQGLTYSTGTLWAVDITNSEIVEYMPNGSESSRFNAPTTAPSGLAATGGTLWLGSLDGSLYSIDTNGTVLGNPGDRDTMYGGLAATESALLGPGEDGNLTVLRQLDTGSDPAMADLTAAVSVSEPAPSGTAVYSGRSFEVTYTLENTGDEAGEFGIIEIESVPSNWTVTSRSAHWDAENRAWVDLSRQLDPDERYQGTATVSVPANATATTRTITATGIIASGIDDTATTTVDVEPSTDPGPANVSISDQTVSESDQSILVDAVTLSDGGFVAIHNGTGVVEEQTGPVLGHSEYLQPGTHTDVRVPLNRAVEDGTPILAVAHAAGNESMVFDGNSPYEHRGVPVDEAARVTVSSESENTSEGSEPNISVTAPATTTIGSQAAINVTGTEVAEIEISGETDGWIVNQTDPDTFTTIPDETPHVSSTGDVWAQIYLSSEEGNTFNLTVTPPTSVGEYTFTAAVINANGTTTTETFTIEVTEQPNHESGVSIRTFNAVAGTDGLSRQDIVELSRSYILDKPIDGVTVTRQDVLNLARYYISQ